jgi:hypothetical protein
MSCFYKKNKYEDGVYDYTEVINTPKFYESGYIEAKKIKDQANPKPNVINVALETIGLSLSAPPCGALPKYDIHNMSGPQVIKLGLLEGIKQDKFYELYLDEEGLPFISEIGDVECTIDTVYYSVIHGLEKVEYCVIIKGLDHMPERIVKDPIPLVVKGEGPGVEVYGLGLFQYETCGNKIFNYNGCISYADPNLQDTTKDEMDSAFELEPFESLIGYTFMCQKPEDVDVVFSDTTQVALDFHIGDPKLDMAQEFVPEEGSVKLEVDVTERYGEYADDPCNPCRFLESEDLVFFYESLVAVLNIDQVIFTAQRITNYKTISDTDYSDVCDIGGEGGEAAGATATADYCHFFDTNIATRQLNIGQDFYYEIKSEPHGKNVAGSEMIKYTLCAGIPVTIEHTLWYGVGGSRPSSGFPVDIIHFAGSSSHIITPFKGIALVSIDKPAIYVTKETDSSIGSISDSGAAIVRDHTEEIREISKEITLVATPIVTLDRPSNTAYCVDGVTTLINMEDCIQDNDPTTMEDLENTPCELMTDATSGKATIDITLPFLETDDEIVSAASLLGEKFSADYNQSVSTVPGHSVSSSDLGKKFNGGIINKIAWSYQDKSFYKATVTTGPFLAGTDSFNTSMWIRRTDQSLSREGIVIGDHGNGLEFQVYVRNIGVYTALNMTMAIIEIGDAVNVTIYNNPAEAYYD